MNVDPTLKAKYGHIFSVEDDDGQEYLFRPFSLSEVSVVESMIINSRPIIEVENFCLETCLVYPEDIDIDDILPGIARQISEQILTISGVTDAVYLQNALHKAREEISLEVITSIKAYIISAIPAYSDRDLEDFTLLQLIEKLILAESILQLQANLSGIDVDVKLEFEFEGQEEQEVPVQKKPKDMPSREELLKAIKKDNVESNPKFTPYNNPDGLDAFQGFDTELLAKMEGRVDPNDPIARKLHGG